MKRLLALLLAVLMIALPLSSLAANFVPERATAYMEIKFKCGCTRGGTGAMIGRRGLITSAHNLYCHNHAQGLEYCNFYFGARSAGSCYYKYNGRFSYTVYNSFRNGYDSSNDIGYVVFESPVGDNTGWYAWLAGTDHDLNQEYVHIMYYDSTRHSKGDWDLAYVRSNTEIYWNAYAYDTGGGPVYFDYEGLDFPTVIGVYTSNDSSGHAYARRLTMDVINDMRADGAFN